MFTENQLAARFQNSPDFIQGGVDFVYRAHSEGHHDRVGAVVVQRNGFSSRLDKLGFDVMLRCIFLSD